MRMRDSQKEKSILETTLFLASQQGVSGFTMADIARKTGLATGTIYVYYKCKRDLMDALYNYMISTKTKAIFDDIDTDLPYRLLFKTTLQKLLLVSCDQRTINSLLVQVSKTHEGLNRPGVERDPNSQFLSKIVERGKSELALMDYDNEVILDTIYALVNSFCNRMKPEPGQIDYEFLEKATKIIWNAVKS